MKPDNGMERISKSLILKKVRHTESILKSTGNANVMQMYVTVPTVDSLIKVASYIIEWSCLKYADYTTVKWSKEINKMVGKGMAWSCRGPFQNINRHVFFKRPKKDTKDPRENDQ